MNNIPCSEIRKRAKILDIIEYTLKQKWKWAGHIARMKDNRWTKRCTQWQPRRGKRSRGRPSRIWQDDITEKEGTTWIRKATDRRQWKTLMEGYILQWMDKAQTETKTNRKPHVLCGSANEDVVNGGIDCHYEFDSFVLLFTTFVFLLVAYLPRNTIWSTPLPLCEAVCVLRHCFTATLPVP